MTAQNIIKAAESIGAGAYTRDGKLYVELKVRGYKAAAAKLAEALGVTFEPDAKWNNKPYWIIGGVSVMIVHFAKISSAYCIGFRMDDLEAEADPETDDQNAMITAATAPLHDILPEVLADTEPSELDLLRAELAIVKAENAQLKKSLDGAREWTEMLTKQGLQMADEINNLKAENAQLKVRIANPDLSEMH